MREAFTRQSAACAGMGSPFMARLMALCADRLGPEGPIGARLHAWAGDLSPAGQSVPLRLAGGLHRLSWDDPALGAVYPPHDPSDAALWTAVAAALDRHADWLDAWLDSPPQTNEVGRSAAFRAAAHVLADRVGLPMVWWELGASAGLNLRWDATALEAGGWRRGPADGIALAPDWTGPPPPDSAPEVVERRGVDLRPVEDPDRLRAYLWPDQPERRARTDALLALPRAPVDAGDAAAWLEDRPSREGRLRVVAHSVAWQYFPEETAARAEAALRAMGAAATAEAPLAHVSMEADGGRGAALRLRVWPGGAWEPLARVDFHGRWVAWRA
nr:DUF2332 family protein [Jannaschia sp. Os4]